MSTFAALVFCLCFLTSLACATLLLRQYAATATRLLLWSGLCFAGLTVTNLLVVFDLLIFPEVDLQPYRTAATVAGLAVLLYGFIWDVD
jgi:hypothetical protein